MLLLEATIGFLVSILVYVVVYPLILAARALWLLKCALSRRVRREAPFSPRDELQDRPSHGSRAAE